MGKNIFWKTFRNLNGKLKFYLPGSSSCSQRCPCTFARSWRSLLRRSRRCRRRCPRWACRTRQWWSSRQGHSGLVAEINEIHLCGKLDKIAGNLQVVQSSHSVMMLQLSNSMHFFRSSSNGSGAYSGNKFKNFKQKLLLLVGKCFYPCSRGKLRAPRTPAGIRNCPTRRRRRPPRWCSGWCRKRPEDSRKN